MIEEKKYPSRLILILIAPLGMVNLIFLAPSLPSLTRYFAVTFSQSHQMVILYSVGYALSQLIYAPISNTYGRKKALYIGIGLAIFGCLLCLLGIYIQSYVILIVGRFITGIGAGAGPVIAFTVVNDVFKDKKARQAIGYCLIGLSVFPGLAALTGGYITQYLGWIFSFYFILFYNIFILFLSLKLPETYKPAVTASIKIAEIWMSLYHAVNNKKIIIAGIMYGLSIGIVFITVAYIPFIGIHILNMNPFLFSICFFIVYMAYTLGSVFNILAAGHFTLHRTLLSGITISLIGGIILIIASITGCTNVFIVFSAVFIAFLGLPLAFANLAVKGISSHEDKAHATSVFNFSFLIIGSISTYLLKFIDTDYILVLGISYVLLMLISLSLYRILFTDINSRI
ncbi:MAG TPA: MFS transporter [Victivallales bacterium]|nr:MFS transporter [Victivallales bacterium]